MEQLMAANECSPRKNMSVGAPISLLPRIGAFICLLMLTMSAAPAVAQQNESEAQLLARARKIHHRVLTLDTHKDISPLLASEAVPEDPAERERFITLHDPRIWGPNQLDFPRCESADSMLHSSSSMWARVRLHPMGLRLPGRRRSPISRP